MFHDSVKVAAHPRSIYLWSTMCNAFLSLKSMYVHTHTHKIRLLCAKKNDEERTKWPTLHRLIEL